MKNKKAIQILGIVGMLVCAVALLPMIISGTVLSHVNLALFHFVNILTENAVGEKTVLVDHLLPLVALGVPCVSGCAFARLIPTSKQNAAKASWFFTATMVVISAPFFTTGAYIYVAVSGVAFTIGMWVYEKMKTVLPAVFNYETMSYIIFGVMTTVVSFVSQMLFASLGTPTWVNTLGSWICAVIFAYVVNKLFVFRSHTDSAKAFFRELWLFFAARLASLGMELVFMIITVDLLHFSEAICKLIAQVFILVANYVFSKLIIFNKKGKE